MKPKTKDERQKEKRATEDEIVGGRRRCSERELGQIPGDGEGQGSLACGSPWGHKESDTPWRLNNKRKGGAGGGGPRGTIRTGERGRGERCSAHLSASSLVTTSDHVVSGGARHGRRQ